MKHSGWVESAQSGRLHPLLSVGVLLFGACLSTGTGDGGNGGLPLPLCFLQIPQFCHGVERLDRVLVLGLEMGP